MTSTRLHQTDRTECGAHASNAPLRPVTPRAVAPVRPARYALRWAAEQ